MVDFTLDTSGHVRLRREGPWGVADDHMWSDLSPFAQGYIEAAFAEWHGRACVLPYVKGRKWPDFEFEQDGTRAFPYAFTDAMGRRWDIVRHDGAWKRTDCQTEGEFPGFRHLAPETLAAMLKDCEAFVRSCHPSYADMARPVGGRNLWVGRQGGTYPAFPPLTLYLGDDGLIYQKEV